MHMFRRCALISMMVYGAGVCLGCASDTTGPQLQDPSHLYYAITLDRHAITLALVPPYDTLHLQATLHTAMGGVLADSDSTSWTTSDSSTVQVNSTGLLTAVAPATGVLVVARHTRGLVTNADTAVINVNDVPTVPRLDTIVLQPNPTPFGFPYYDLIGGIQFIPSALDTHGDTIANVAFHLTSATPAILAPRGPSNETYVRQSTGHALLIADATVYGVRKVVSFPFTVGWWHQVVVEVLPRIPAGGRTPIATFFPAEDTVAAGGAVIWRNELTGQSVDVVFDDSNAVQAVDSATFLEGEAQAIGDVVPTQGGGNIPPFAPLDTGALKGRDTLGVRARRFPTAGTYRYHSVLYGTSGVIHVLPEFQVP